MDDVQTLIMFRNICYSVKENDCMYICVCVSVHVRVCGKEAREGDCVCIFGMLVCKRERRDGRDILYVDVCACNVNSKYI